MVPRLEIATDRRIEILNWGMVVGGAIERHMGDALEEGRMSEVHDMVRLADGVAQTTLATSEGV